MFRLLIVFSFLTINIFTNSQQITPNIEKSKEKIIINGKIYYLHTVKNGQTLYSISKIYNVTIDDILTANPGLNPTQIKEGTPIKIPESFDNKDNINHNPDINNNYILHKVKQGETLYFLSKKYNVEIEEIIKANPGLEILKSDQMVKIPRKGNNTKKDSIIYITYELNKKDTLYSIAQKYNTSVAEIIALNPELKNGIKKGLKIKIPIVVKTDSSQFKTQTYTDCDRKPKEKDEYRYLILIPHITDSISSISQNNETIYKFYNFYKGIIIALDSLKNIGKTSHIKIIEVNPNNKNNSLINHLEFKPDFVINFFADLDSLFVSNCFSKKIPIIMPIDTEKKGNNLTSSIKILTNHYYLDYLYDYIKQNTSNKKINLIIVNDRTNNFLIDSSKNIKNKKTENINLHIININDSTFYNIQKAIDTLNQNIVFINSTNEGTVSILLSRFNLINKNINIDIIGVREWLYFNKIDIDLLHKLNIKVLSPVYIDYKNKAINYFLYKNVNMYGIEPLKTNFYDILTFLGYDIILLSVDLKNKYNDIITCLTNHSYNGILTTYYLVKEKNDEIINKSYSLIIYEKGYTIRREIKFLNTEEKLISVKK